MAIVKTLPEMQKAIAGIDYKGIFGAGVKRSLYLSDIFNTQFCDEVDDLLTIKAGNRLLFEQYQFEDGPMQNFMPATKAVQFQFEANSYKWRKLIATTALTYDPITNYDKTETEKITDNTIIEATSTSNSGERTGTTTASKAGYDSAEFQNSDKTQNVIAPVVDSGKNNTATKYTHEKELKTVGNIGTMTTQTMITEERDISMFSVVEMVASEVMDLLTVGVFYEY